MELLGVPLSLPGFVTDLRPHQAEAAEQIVEHFKTKSVVFLDAPTGAGKTLIGEVVRQLVRSGHHGPRLAQCLYVCSSKSLQDQFLHDFSYAKVIKGRSNYPTYDQPHLFNEKGARHLDASYCTKVSITRGDLPACDKCEFSHPDWTLSGEDDDDDEAPLKHCMNCHPWQQCPYERAKWAALEAQLAVANTAYFLTEANFVGRFGADNNGNPAFPLVIVDEADSLESVLMSFVEVSFSRQAVKEFGIGQPTKKTVSSAWLTWVEQAQIKLRELRKFEIRGYGPDEPLPHNVKRKVERLDSYIKSLEYAEKSLRLEPDNWVYDGSRDGVVLKPVRISSHAKELFWRHGRKFLLMSATIISPHQMADDLGLTPDQWGFVAVDSNFPPERRPVIVSPRANMTNKTKEMEWPKMVNAVDEVLSMFPRDRALVHTVSYAWTEYLYNKLMRTDHAERLLTYSDGRERESVLEAYKQRPNGVLLAPSFDRGIDLPDDLCRLIIITKVPFPNLGDEQIKRRFYGTGASGKSWYATETIRSIVQMTGRGMRHKDDHVVSYILDAQFASNLWQNAVSRNRLPPWWVRALKWETPRRTG